MSNPIDTIVKWFIENPTVRSIGFHYLPKQSDFSLPEWAVSALFVDGHDDGHMPYKVFGIPVTLNLNKPAALSDQINIDMFRTIAECLSDSFKDKPFVLNMQVVKDIRCTKGDNRVSINCKTVGCKGADKRAVYMGVHL